MHRIIPTLRTLIPAAIRATQLPRQTDALNRTQARWVSVARHKPLVTPTKITNPVKELSEFIKFPVAMATALEKIKQECTKLEYNFKIIGTSTDNAYFIDVRLDDPADAHPDIITWQELEDMSRILTPIMKKYGFLSLRNLEFLYIK